ncbi:MAG: tetraacyldisaccharide 4'-kinase [Myxococcota bacterium]
MPDYLWRSDPPALERALLAGLAPAEAGYRIGGVLHRSLYAGGLLRRVRLPLQVVSVGNLAVGGSAKTPLVAWLARGLRGRGCKVAVLSRGVGGAGSRRVNVVSDGERIRLGSGEVGDEPVWIAGQAPGVPVLAGRDRAALALRAIALFGTQIALLDDGFQHHRLARDLDLVCLDAGLGLGNRHLLPRGPLREPPGSLRRASAIVWTRAAEGRELPDLGGAAPRDVPQFRVALEPAGLEDLSTGESRSLDTLCGARLGVLAAIARPDRLERDLEHLGAHVIARQIRRDHAQWRPRDLELLSRDHAWVTTGKDAVKLPSSWLGGRRVYALVERVREADGQRLLAWLVEQLGGEGA